MFDVFSKYLTLLAQRMGWPLFLGGLGILGAEWLGLVDTPWLDPHRNLLIAATILAGTFALVDATLILWEKIQQPISEAIANWWFRRTLLRLSIAEQAVVYWCAIHNLQEFRAPQHSEWVRRLIEHRWVQPVGTGDIESWPFEFEWKIWSRIQQNHSVFQRVKESKDDSVPKVWEVLDEAQ